MSRFALVLILASACASVQNQSVPVDSDPFLAKLRSLYGKSRDEVLLEIGAPSQRERGDAFEAWVYVKGGSSLTMVMPTGTMLMAVSRQKHCKYTLVFANNMVARVLLEYE